MLKIIIPTIMLYPISWLTPQKWLWTTSVMHSFIIAFTSLYCKWDTEMGWDFTSLCLGVDPLSSPLLTLTCWLLPLMLLASQNHLNNEPYIRQRIYISLLITLQLLLLMAFGATEMILFYITFEATLIPTLIIITRWGNQTERLNAGTYFLFYTLMGSMPLLIALLVLQNNIGSLSMLTLQFPQLLNPNSWANKLWWFACLIAFLVKMPLYGVHLWLPKAHVEAPIAGSMILAAILLKLGGYGMMRIILVLSPLTKEMAFPFLILALWGIIMTSSTCLRQTDLKSLIAYSSVSHMGLVAAAILIQAPWSFAGAIALMIAHGLISSALFCLANTNYERTHTRTLLLTRGTQIILPLMATSWFITNLANLALPPSPNLMGEILIISSLFKWSQWTIIITGLGVLLTASYSLYMFIMTQRGPIPPYLTLMNPSHTREHLLMYLHLIPTLLIISKPELILSWTY
uniref:NADH-ubiquinone oxidoreductase chain 4 n=1 Tax=Styracura schmardae TaxID=2034277 RepID=G9FMR3_9CHON|nr:NADH dehydrogenase subunit 4 [Styracura schmardae]